jgi:uncharacterized membrane-anchored protein
MKLKKITCFLQTDAKEKGLRRTIIPSGFKGSWLIMEENYAYDIGAVYLHPDQVKEFQAAKKKLRAK